MAHSNAAHAVWDLKSSFLQRYFERAIDTLRAHFVCVYRVTALAALSFYL